MEDKNSGAAGGKKELGANLRHLGRRNVVHDPPVATPFLDTATEKLPPATTVLFAAIARAVRWFFTFLRDHPMKFFALLGVVALLFLAAIIVPHIPAQMQRNAGVAASERGEYQLAFDNLSAYLLKRPDDGKIALMAAEAALRLNNTAYAAQHITRLYESGALPGAAGLPYHYALLNADKPEVALPVLDRLINDHPDHAAGLLLRGLLSRNDKEKFRKSRDDIIRADEAIRASNRDFDEVVFLHRHITQSGALFLAVNAPPLPPLSARESQTADLAGFDTGWDGYINLYELSFNDAFMNDALNANAIALMYSAYVLMAQSDFAGAQVELKEALATAPGSPALEQMKALALAGQGEHEEAAEIFSRLASETSQDARTVNNLAVAEWLKNPVAANIDAVLAVYDNVLNSEAANLIAANNSAFLHLLRGDYEAADALLAGIAEPNDAVRLNLALVSMWRGDFDAALAQFGAIRAAAFPNIARFIAAAQIKDGNIRAAMGTLNRLENARPQNPEPHLTRINLIMETDEKRVAFVELKNFAEKHPDVTRARFLLGVLSLDLNEDEEFTAQKAAVLSAPDRYRHYADALKGAELARQGKTGDAAFAYFRAMEAAPTTPLKQEHAVHWGRLHAEQDAAAVAEKLTALLDEKFNPALAAVLAYARARGGDEGAAEVVRQATAEGRKNGIIQKYGGMALAALGEHTKALPLLEAARRWSPTDIPVLAALAKTQQSIGDEQSALETRKVIEYLQAVAAGAWPEDRVSYQVFLPTNRSLARKIRVALESRARPAQEAALREYDTFIDRMRDNEQRSQLLRSRATFRVFIKRYEGALEDFEAALASGFQNRADTVGTMLFYAKILGEVGRHGEAAAAIGKVIDIGADTPLHKRLRAMALANDQRTEEAVDLLTNLARRHPDQPETYNTLMRLEYVRQDYARAIGWGGQAMRALPDYAPVYRQMSEIYAARGDDYHTRLYARVYSSTANTAN